MKQSMTSRERMLAAIECLEPDHVPCSFMLYKALLTSSPDYRTFIERELEMGLDAFVMLPPRPPIVVNDHYNLHGLPVSFDSSVSIREWIEHPADQHSPLLIKEYTTPAGTLRAEVRQTDDWPRGEHVPFLDDHLSPRSKRFIVTQPEELSALEYLLIPPTKAEIYEAEAESRPIIELAKDRGLLVVGGWGVGADMLGWIYGLENMVLTTYSDPQFLRDLLNIIAVWNHSRMKVLLDLGIDLYIKRAWYETCNFWSPKLFREFLLPILKSDVEICHSAGVKFGYIVTSATMPLLDQYAEAEVDVLIGVDPRDWDLAKTKETLDKKICLWGGVNGHLTVEGGTEVEVRHEVRAAMGTLSPGGGFVLSPVDNVRHDTELSRQNVAALIDEWQKLI